MGVIDLLWSSYLTVFWVFVHSAHFGCFVQTQCYLPLGHLSLPPSLLAFLRALFASFPINFQVFLHLADLLLVLQCLLLLYIVLHFFKKYGKSIALIIFLTWVILITVYYLSINGREGLQLKASQYIQQYRIFVDSIIRRFKDWLQGR